MAPRHLWRTPPGFRKLPVPGLVFTIICALWPRCEGTAEASASNPLQKVIQLMVELQAKVIADGEQEQKNYNEAVKWCSKAAFDSQAEIKAGKAKQEDLEARAAKAETDGAAAKSLIDSLSGSIATDEADLKAVTLLRAKERQDFEALDAELSSTIDTLNRAIGVLKKQMEMGGLAGQSFLQRPTNGMKVFTSALTDLVSAATVIADDDRDVLVGLLQRTQKGATASDDTEAQASEDGSSEEELGAPSSEVYSGKKSHGVLDALQELLKKTETAQSETRSKEQNRRSNFEKLKASLEGKLAMQAQELEEAKGDAARASELKAQAEKELEVTVRDLEADEKTLEQIQRDCMGRATQFQEQTRQRGEELNALAAAKKAVQESSGGGQVYSFVQVRSRSRRTRSSSAIAVAAPSSDELVTSGDTSAEAGSNALKQLRELAKRTGSLALTQLASRASTALRYALNGHSVQDPFAKVKTMIQNMIIKLEKEAEDESQQKKFCDREMAHTTKNMEDKQDEVGGLTTRLETAAAEVARLQEEVKTLSRELADIALSQAEMDKIRKDESSTYMQAKADVEGGLSATQTALTILQNYYGGAAADDSASAALMQEDMDASMAAEAQGQGGEASQGSSGGDSSGDGAPKSAATSILGLLQVVEADFAKTLAELNSEESSAQDSYKKLSQDNRVAAATRRTEVENKNREVSSLRKTAAELMSDRTQSQQELDAINEYWQKLKPQCIQEPTSYKDRIARRQEEMEGLQQALDTLESSSSSSSS